MQNYHIFKREGNMKNCVHLFLVALALISAISADSRWVQTEGPGGGDIIKFLTNRNGVFRSINNGDTWSAINISGQRYEYINTITSKNLTIYAATSIGLIYRSLDNGVTWTKVCDSIKENIYIKTLVVNKEYLRHLLPCHATQSTDQGQHHTRRYIWQWYLACINSTRISVNN
jgi:hypothetical protein